MSDGGASGGKGGPTEAATAGVASLSGGGGGITGVMRVHPAIGRPASEFTYAAFCLTSLRHAPFRV